MGQGRFSTLKWLGACAVGVLLQACLSPNGDLSFETFTNSGLQNPSFSSLFWAGPTAVSQGACVAFTLSSQSSYGIALPVSAPTLVQVGNAGAITFYSDSTCTVTTQTAIIPAGASEATVYFSGNTIGNLIFQGSATGYNVASYSVNVVAPGTPVKLVFTTEPSTAANSGAAFGIQPVIQTQDASGTLVPGATNGVSVVAYTNSSCTTPVIIGSLGTASASTAEGVSHFTGLAFTTPVSQTIYIGVISTGLAPACSSAVAVSEQASPMVVTGDGAACALSHTGNVYCWGNNAFGQLGNNTTTNSLLPVEVNGVGGSGFLSNVVSIAGNSNSDHFCAVVASGTAYCWGRGVNGELGNGQATNDPAPVAVANITGAGTLPNVASVSVGLYHSCASTLSGNAYCWGEGSFGKLGNNANASDAYSPVQVVGTNGSGVLTGVSSINAGGNATCAAAGMNVYCWGDAYKGALGNDGSTGSYLTPVEVLDASGSSALSGIVSVSVSNNYGACAVSLAGNVYCWGDNSFNQLSNTGLGSSYGIPSEIVGAGGTTFLTGISHVSYGQLEICAISAIGSAYCWGEGQNGSLGTGSSPTETSVPVQVQNTANTGGLESVSSISVGLDGFTEGYACAVVSTNVYCWGSNNFGQLGQNNEGTPFKTLPVEVTLDGTHFLTL